MLPCFSKIVEIVLDGIKYIWIHFQNIAILIS
jgi:hypothetical protein